MESEIDLEITLKKPLEGIGFCLQKGKDEKIDYQISNGEDITFAFSVRVKEGKGGSPNFLGDFTQGNSNERFVYICIGQYAGQKDTEWARRVKIKLSSISWAQINQVKLEKKAKLVASYEATDKKGEPSCASVPLVGKGWIVKK